LIIRSLVGAGLQETTSLHPLLSLSSGKDTGGMTNCSPPLAMIWGNRTNPSDSQTTSVLFSYLCMVNGNTSSPMISPSDVSRTTVGSGGGLNLGSFTMQMTLSRFRASLNPLLSTSMFPMARTVDSSLRSSSRMSLSR